MSIERAAADVVALVSADALTIKHSRQVALDGYLVVDGVVYVGTRLAVRLQVLGLVFGVIGGGAG